MRPKQTGKKISTTKARQETEHFKETIISILEEITDAKPGFKERYYNIGGKTQGLTLLFFFIAEIVKLSERAGTP